jgi:pimeloyl-ACP methyl ester carboxylesterase
MGEFTIGSFRHDGLEFRTVVAGAGPAIVFLHGGHSRADHFRGVMERLAPRFRVVAYDMRGYGRTGADARPITHEDWAGDLIACLDHFGLAQPGIVGWSLGASTALEAIGNNPGRARGLVLMGAPRPARRFDRAVFQRRIDIVAAGGGAAEVVAETFSHIAQTMSPLTRERRPEVVDSVRRELLAEDPRLLAKLVEAYGVEADWKVVLPKVRCPATFLVGDADTATPRDGAEELASLMPDATVRIVPECGHYYAAEQPAAVAEMIAEALAPAAAPSDQSAAPAG